MKLKLLIVQGRPEGKSMVFPRGEYVFGRGEECHVRPNSDWVSRQHCLLRVTADGAYLRDLGSRNGTLVNGVLLSEELQLQNGDQVQLGPLVFEVRVPPGPQPRRGDTPPTTAADVTKGDSSDATAATDAARISTETFPAFQQPESEQKK